MRIKRNPSPINPFIKDGDIIKGKGLTITTEDDRSGIIQGNFKLAGSFAQIREDIIPLLIGMSSKSQLLPLIFALFMHKILKDKDVINETYLQMSYADAKEIAEKYTDRVIYPAQFSNCIKQLKQLNFLHDHPKGSSVYWFNPNMIFNGKI